MGLITTFYGSKAWNFKYSKSGQSGFYYTNRKEDIAHNCQAFEIDLEDQYLMGAHYLKEFDSFFVYTARAGGRRYQYIVLNTASHGDVIEFAQTKPKQIAQQLYKRLGLVPIWIMV